MKCLVGPAVLVNLFTSVCHLEICKLRELPVIKNEKSLHVCVLFMYTVFVSSMLYTRHIFIPQPSMFY